MSESAPHYATCDCLLCGGHIEFPATGAGQIIQCPHCGRDTRLFIPETAAPARPNLRTCEDCGREVSVRAEICPHCGAPRTTAPPRKPPATEVGERGGAGAAEVERSGGRGLIERTATAAALVILILLGYFSISDFVASRGVEQAFQVKEEHAWLRPGSWAAAGWLAYVGFRFLWRKFREGYLE